MRGALVFMSGDFNGRGQPGAHRLRTAAEIRLRLTVEVEVRASWLIGARPDRAQAPSPSGDQRATCGVCEWAHVDGPAGRARCARPTVDQRPDQSSSARTLSCRLTLKGDERPTDTVRALRTSLIAAVCLAACSQQTVPEPPLPEPPADECMAQSIKSLCRNSTGVIRARVSRLEAPVVFRWRDHSAWLTRARIDGLTVTRGRGPIATDQVYFSGKVRTLKPEPLYLFINDRIGELPPYALGCGGIYWPVPSDGGEPLVQSTYDANPKLFWSGERPGDIITEANFLLQVESCSLSP